MIGIIDNFLSEEEFSAISKLMLHDTFSWYYNLYTVPKRAQDKELGKYDFQFCHIFYKVNEEYGYLETNSDNCYFLNPILKKLNCLHLIRAKANLRSIYKGEQENHPHYYHTDIHYPHWQIPTVTAIFYLNTNNGYTIFEDKKQKVECVANRLVKFNTTMRHAAVGTTDSKTRVVINFNYIERQNG